MSSSTSTARAHAKATTAHTAAPAAQDAPPAATATIEIAEISVTIPLKFSPGHVLTENQAKILDAAYQRQFVNNQNANAKARAEKLAKATTDAEKAAAAPLTAADYAKLYENYEPTVGGAPRMGNVEKMRQDAAWRMWVALVGEHNKAVASGGTAVIAKAVSKADGKPVPVALMRAPTKAEVKAANAGATEEALETAYKTAQEEFAGAKAVFLGRILSMPEYAERVQIQLDAIMAERGEKKPAAKAEMVVASADVL